VTIILRYQVRMPRRPRIQLDNVPPHIVQRRHNREACFLGVEDYQRYSGHSGHAGSVTVLNVKPWHRPVEIERLA
jgi:hypothetical protein